MTATTDKLAQALRERFECLRGHVPTDKEVISAALEVIAAYEAEVQAVREDHFAGVRNMVPHGWKLVPVDPTDAMRIAGGIALESSPAHDVIGPLVDAWAAMLAAAPQPEEQSKPAAIVREDMGRKWADLTQDLPPGALLYSGAALAAADKYLGEQALREIECPPDPEVVQVADEFDQIVEQLAEVSCPRCLGTQTIPAMSDNGPDAYEVEVCCDHCEGSGTAKGAYEALAKFKQRASIELTQLRYFHWHTKEQEKKSAALAAQQAEREGLTEEQFSEIWAGTILDDATQETFEHGLGLLSKVQKALAEKWCVKLSAHGIGKDQS